MGLFDFMSSRSSSQNQSTTSIADSYNRTFSSSTVQDNMGNVTINTGEGQSILATMLPVVAVAGVVVVGAIMLGQKGRR